MRPRRGDDAKRRSRRLSDVESPILTYHARLLLGHALARGGDSAGAYASYQIARDALETLRSRLNGEELKIAFVKNKGEVYERLVQLCLEGQEGTGGFEQAFTLVEQAKSRTLFDLMFQPVHALAREEGSESQLAHSIRELREELNWYYHLVELEQLRPGDQSEERLSAFQREIGSAREGHGAHRARAHAHRRAAVGSAGPEVYSLDAIRAALPADTTLVEYFTIEDRIVLCLVDRERVEMAPVSLMSRVASQIRMLQFQFSKFRLGADYIKTFEQTLLTTTRAHLHEIFKELLAPAWSQLRGRRLVIVPHGALHYVPFHALFDRRAVRDRCLRRVVRAEREHLRPLPAAEERWRQRRARARRRRRAGAAHRCRGQGRGRGAARRAALHRPRRDRAGAAHVGPRQPHRPHRLARLLPSGEPDVLGHPSRATPISTSTTCIDCGCARTWSR